MKTNQPDTKDQWNAKLERMHTWNPSEWIPVGFKSFADVPMHYRALDKFDGEVETVFNSDGVKYFHKPSTDQYWIQIGFLEDSHGRKHCPTHRCDAQCCREGLPWPEKYFPQKRVAPCPFLKEDNNCGIQGSKFICCVQAPMPWNDMGSVDKCEIRTVEVRPNA